MNIQDITEKECVIGFIDILGFKDIMNSSDEDKRKEVILLLYNIHELTNKAKVNIQNMGIGTIQTFDVSVSTFSDNIVISFPIDDPDIQFHNIHMFLGELFRIIINTVVDALQLGVLFRGAITIGRMHHNGNIVAGSGLVNAVIEEEAAKHPMIIIDERIINYSTSAGDVLIDEYYKTLIQIDEDGKSFLNCLMPHRSYAMYANENNQYGTNIFSECYRIIYENIRNAIQPQIQASIGRNWEDKYNWLKHQFDKNINKQIEEGFLIDKDKELLLN